MLFCIRVSEFQKEFLVKDNMCRAESDKSLLSLLLPSYIVVLIRELEHVHIITIYSGLYWV